jgi:hypothetical protein
MTTPDPVGPGLPRPARTRLPGDPPPSRIGHNQGPPLDPARTWRLHCWRSARGALLPTLPIEIVRRRVARARELGLAYPAYASILLGSGRDVTAFLFTAEAIGLRVRRMAELSRAAAAKLPALTSCDRLLLAETGADPAEVGRALALSLNLPFRAVAAAPPASAALPEGRAAIRGLIDPLRLPADAVVVVGALPHERAWAEAARTAAFLSADAYFAA